jgi:hypothetical protein
VAAAAVAPPEKKFTLPPGLTEISGLAMSAKHPGIVYAHNDSGNTADIFAIDTATGQLKAKLSLSGAPNTDWEAIAVGKDESGRTSIYVGDIGNNFGGRDPIVYRLPEPDTLADATVAATKFQLKFADGAKDAESMPLDPTTGQLYVASKNYTADGRLYAAPNPLNAGQTNTLSDTGRPAPKFATDGAFSPDGKAYALRSGGPLGENSAWFYDTSGKQLAKVALPSQGQGEAITYFDRTSVLVASENDSQVWLVHLPPEAIPGSDPPPPGDAPTVSGPGDQTSAFNKAVNVQVRASGGTGALTYKADGLPFGLTIGSNGVITGKAWQVGTFTVKVTATDTAGKSGSATFTWTVGWF